MAENGAMKTFWHGHAETPNVQTMMLHKNAGEIDEMDRKDIRNSLPDLSGLRVVEIGSGIGRFTSYLAGTAKHVLATDLVQSFIDKNEVINSRFDNITFKCADAMHLDVEAESCDFVFTNWLLMYLTDEEVVQFLQNVLRWLSPNGQLHLRESCSEPSRRTQKVPDDPTQYRHIYQYLRLIDSIRIPDSTNGGLVKFEVIWAKSVETYVQIFQNWRQVHMLIRKVAVTDQDSHFSPKCTSQHGLIRLLRDIALNERERFAKEMIYKKDLLKSFFLKCLKARTDLSASDSVLCLFHDPHAWISPFAIAEKFDCNVHHIDTRFDEYDYHLAQANAKRDERVRFSLFGQRVENTEKSLPRSHFDVVVGSGLGKRFSVEEVVTTFGSLLRLHGKIVLLERMDEAATTALFSKKSGRHGSVELIDTEDVTKEVQQLLLPAVTADGYTEFREILQQDGLLQANEDKWYIVTITMK